MGEEKSAACSLDRRGAQASWLAKQDWCVGGTACFLIDECVLLHASAESVADGVLGFLDSGVLDLVSGVLGSVLGVVFQIVFQIVLGHLVLQKMPVDRLVLRPCCEPSRWQFAHSGGLGR